MRLQKRYRKDENYYEKKGVTLLVGVISLLMYAPTIEGQVEQEEIFYSNELGLELTESEYNEIIEYIPARDLNVFTEEELSYVMSDFDNNVMETNETFVKTTYEIVDGEQEIISEEYISEQEMKDSLNVKNIDISEVSPYMLIHREQTVETTMKSIVMNMYSVDVSVKKVSLTCTWLSIPQCKSFDVVAFRPDARSFVCEAAQTNNTIGYQYHDDSVITYRWNYDNIKYINGGVGLSTNIVDSVTSSLIVQFSTTFATVADPLTVYGTYQHAVNNVTLSQSQKYDILWSGMGRVLEFNDSVYSKYDQTPGLYVTGSVYDS